MAVEVILEYLLGNGITTSLKSLSNFPVGQVGHQSVQKYCHLLMQIHMACVIGTGLQVELPNKLLEYMFPHAQLVLDMLWIANEKLPDP